SPLGPVRRPRYVVSPPLPGRGPRTAAGLGIRPRTFPEELGSPTTVNPVGAECHVLITAQLRRRLSRRAQAAVMPVMPSRCWTRGPGARVRLTGAAVAQCWSPVVIGARRYWRVLALTTAHEPCDLAPLLVWASAEWVGDTGFEPVTSSVSRKRATAAPIARTARWVRDSNPCIRLCRPLPRLSANPPGDDVRPVVSILGPPPPSG